MIRFNNTNKPKNKKLLIFISDFIRKIFGGDRLKRISKEITNISKKISQRNQKKIVILDFGCGSGDFLRLVKSYSEKVVGVELQKNYVETIIELS